MTTNDIIEKMLICPKKIQRLESFYNGNCDDVIKFNFNDRNKYDYLLKICGFEGKKTEQSKTIANTTFGLVIGRGLEEELPEVEIQGEEAFSLRITERNISVNANTKNGLAFGLKALARIFAEFDNIPCMEIQDAPTVDFRSLHICIFNPDDGTVKDDTSPKSVRKMLINAAMSGYNYIIMEFWGMFPYKKRPYACWPHSQFTREIVKELIDFAIDDLHITPIPCQNLTSHAGWSRIDSRKHVVLDQRPDLASMWIPGGWCFATENPYTQEFLKDTMEDLLETFRNPPFFHASCDKCFGFASSEADRTKPADILFIKHLCFINDFLQKHNARMIMWGDMLYSSIDALYWKANPAMVNYLPKNILINIWTHNNPGKIWPDIEFFQNKGFEAVYSPFIDRSGISSMIDLCIKHKSFGIVQTTWHRPILAAPSVVYSGAEQWSGKSCINKNENTFLSKWYYL